MKLVAFPRDANPYQELLYGAMRKQGVVVDYVEGPTTSHTLNVLLLPLILVWKRLQGYTVFHIHWTFSFALPGGVLGSLGRGCMELWAAWTWFVAKVCGMRLVWTAHNVMPHEPLFLNDRRAHRFLGNRADRIIVHNEAARQQVQALGVTNRHIQVIPHGSYSEVIPDSVTPKAARQKLDISAVSTVFLFFGLMRPQKGVEKLLAAFEGSADEHAVLLVVGQVRDEALRKLLEDAAHRDSRIRLVLKYVANEDVQYYFKAADFAVLPYEQSTTSGVALLACSFGCPIIAPDQAAFTEIPVGAQISYQAGGLQQALQTAAKLSDAERHVLAVAAYTYAKQLSWDAIASKTIAFIGGQA